MNEKNGNGKAPLHIAAEKNNIDHIKILLNKVGLFPPLHAGCVAKTLSVGRGY